MNETTFWDIIELFDWEEAGDDDAVLEPAVQALAALDQDAIFTFDDILSEKLHSLDTRKHCRACYAGELDPDDGNDYISADDFLYSRCVVVANGRDFYASVVADPAKMPQGMEFESLLSLPSSAYERKTGSTNTSLLSVTRAFRIRMDGHRLRRRAQESALARIFLQETVAQRSVQLTSRCVNSTGGAIACRAFGPRLIGDGVREPGTEVPGCIPGPLRGEGSVRPQRIGTHGAAGRSLGPSNSAWSGRVSFFFITDLVVDLLQRCPDRPDALLSIKTG
jgi:hypothetical protein